MNYKTAFYISLTFIFSLILFIVTLITEHKSYSGLYNDKEIISIHQYNERVNYSRYQSSIIMLQRVIMYDLSNDNKIDSVLLKNLKTLMTVEYRKSISIDDLMHKEDSLSSKWYESINYMFMNSEHDSTWVKNSDTYKEYNGK